MKYHFKAVRADGTVVEGEREALDRSTLSRDLRAEGLTATQAKLVEELAAKHHLHFRNPLATVRMKDKVVFAGSLSSMLGAGLSRARSLAVLQRQVRNRRLQAVIADIASRVNSGGTLSSALSANPDIFPPLFIAMVGAGEESGKLAESLEIVRSQMAKAYDLRRKVKGAMIYPAIILVVIVAIGTLMMIYLVPNLTSMFSELKVELPLSTRIIIALSNFLSQHTLSFLAIVFATIALLIRVVRTARGKRLVTRVALRLPGIGTIMRNLNAAVTMRTLSSLISSGVSMLESITITQKVIQNPFHQAVLAEAATGVEKGAPLSTSFRTHEELYPVLVGEMTEVGEETGNLPGMLLKGAVFFEDEVDQATKNLSTIIEPALMVFIGLCVGFFAISMLGPMYSLSESI